MVKIGVLAVQGDFLEHIELLKEINIDTKLVKKPKDMDDLDALIIPGGESTTIGELIEIKGLDHSIRNLAERGLLIVGICAGAIILAKKVTDRVVGLTGQYTLGLMNIEVVRNIFGRQRDSFIADIELDGVGRVRAAFIRAPGIIHAWEPAKITGFIEHPSTGRVGCMAVQGNLIALTFHPEITGDTKIYRYFVDLIKS